MKKRKLLILTAGLVLVFISVFSSCDLEGRKMRTNDQDMTIFRELAYMSRRVLPKDFGNSSITTPYNSTVFNGDASGTATLSGEYRYVYADVYISSTSNRIDRTWNYNDIVFNYNNYRRDNDTKITIISGSLTVSGVQSRSVRYTGYYGSTTTESGSVSIKGTVKVEGYVDGADVLDTVTIDVVYECIGGSWFHNGKIWNSQESYLVVYE